MSVEAATETESGRVRGEPRARHVAFRGVPFAAPPSGLLRFRPPELVQPWAGVRDAVAYGPSAMQGESFAPGSAAEGRTSEDCLYLNVFTPAARPGKRPVLVFVHGGAFIVGSSGSPLYDGGRLAAEFDQVVVTFNYRLGPFGFLSLGAAGDRWGAAANLGLLDQAAALRWVQRNIERFGGDPSNVTVFGESAGATSVLLLMAMPAASGLFHRAIAESPTNALTLPGMDDGQESAEQLLAQLGLGLRDSERLLALPAEAIAAAQKRMTGRRTSLFRFAPVLDPRTFPVQPAVLFASGGGAKVPLVVGTNRDEWNLFALPTPGDRDPVPDLVGAIVASGFPGDRQAYVSAMVDVYRESRRALGLPHHDRAVLRAIVGDLRFRVPAIRFAEAHAGRGVPTHAYLFTYGSPAMRGALGACHALELPFVFGTLDAPSQDRFAGTGARVEELSSTMRQAWSAFARTGDPDVDAAAAWPRFDSSRRATRVFDVPCRLEHAPLDDERRAWAFLGQ